jgi:hypothetical protein
MIRSSDYVVVARFAAAIAMLLSQAACHCKAGSSWCDGKTLSTCYLGGEDSPPRLSSTVCEVACVQASVAFCSLSAEPIEPCTSPEGWTDALPAMPSCWGNRWAWCLHGYPMRDYGPSDECPSGTFCKTVQVGLNDVSVPICSLFPQLDPRCPARSSSSCSGSVFVGCMGGYSVYTARCASADRCKTIPGPYNNEFAVCTLAADTDSICANAFQTSWVRCDNSVMTQCIGGYVVYRATCASGAYQACFAETGLDRVCQYGILDSQGLLNGQPPACDGGIDC